MSRRLTSILSVMVFFAVVGTSNLLQAEDWLQYKFDSGHSGNAPDRSVATPLGLVGTVPLTDAVLTSPVVADGRIYVVDGSGVAFCIDAKTLKVIWKVATQGGKGNCNNISSPLINDR